MKLKGKTINFLGDSITEGCCVENINNRYDNILKGKYQLKEVFNYGVGGTRIAHQSKPSENPRHDLCFCGRASFINMNADITVVYGGVNDYLHGDASIGCIDDETPETFYGGVNYLMRYLKNNFLDKLIVFMTPAHCNFYGVSDSVPSPHSAKRENSPPLKAYVDAIVHAGKLNGIPVLNLYEDLGIDLTDDEIRREFTADGLHLNDKGQYYIAEALGEFLEKL